MIKLSFVCSLLIVKSSDFSSCLQPTKKIISIRFAVKFATHVGLRKAWHPGFDSECDEERGSFDGAVERSIVGEH